MQTVTENPRAKGQTLHALLITPVQRVPRYKLLLMELRKQTRVDHTDIPFIDEALDGVGAAATFINETIRARENRENCAILEKRFTTKLNLAEGVHARYVVKEGVLARVTRHGLKDYYFHLFSDILLYSEERIDKTFKLHRRIELTNASVQDKCHTADEPNAFSVSSTEKSFVCCAGDLTSKNGWLALLQETIASCKEQSKIDISNDVIVPVWENSAGGNCVLCHKNFTILRRRHHCRQCGALVCDACSDFRKLLKHIDAKKELRVCRPCNIKRDDDDDDGDDGDGLILSNPAEQEHEQREKEREREQREKDER
jgi:hypothetical protein